LFVFLWLGELDNEKKGIVFLAWFIWKGGGVK